MKIAKFVNGNIEYREETKEEIEEREKWECEHSDAEPTLTPEERLSKVEQRTDALETNSDEIREALDMLLSGVTE